MFEWEKYPKMAHLKGSMQDFMEVRRRHRNVRYLLYRLRNAAQGGAPLVDALPGFVPFWLGETPSYALNAKRERIPVPPHRDKTVGELGGYDTFAVLWDVDEDLKVYLRFSSVWQEWNATLMRVVPILGE